MQQTAVLFLSFPPPPIINGLSVPPPFLSPSFESPSFATLAIFLPLFLQFPKALLFLPLSPRLGFGCSFAVSFTFPSPPRRSLCLSSPASSIPFYVPSAAATPISSSGGGGGAKHCPQGRGGRRTTRKEAMIYYRFSLFQSRGGGERLHGREEEEERTEARLFSFLPPKEGEEGGGESVIAAVLPPFPPSLAFLASLLPWLLVVGVFGFVGRWCALLPPSFTLPPTTYRPYRRGARWALWGPGNSCRNYCEAASLRRSLRRGD